MVWSAVPRAGQAQAIQLNVQRQPLSEALTQLRAQSDVDVVYARRLVEGKRSACQYAGTNSRDALRCLLKGTGLEAQRVRRNQYVIVSIRGAGASSEPVRKRVLLSGFVTDAETGEALPGAHVYLTELQVGTTTNNMGYFALSSLPPGPYQAQISFLGYQRQDTTLVAASGANHRVNLQPGTLVTDGVLVEAGRNHESERRRLPGMLSVELDQVSRMPSLSDQDLFQTLQWTPGIRKSGILNGGLSVRGAKPDQNLYLLDGAPVYHPWHAFSLISTFQTGTLKTTNLYRGAFPAEHGGRLSSVLEAQMKDGSRKQPSAEVALSALSGRFRVESPITPSVSFMLSGRRSYIDKLIGREHPVRNERTGRRDTLRTGYYFYDSSAKLSARFSDRHHLSLSFYRGRDDLDLRLPFDLSLNFSSWLRPADLFFEVQQGWENQLYSAQHQYLATDRLFVTTTAYYSRYRAQEGSFVQPTSTASLTSDYSVDLHDVGLKVDADYYHSVAHRVRAGLQIARQHFESTLATDVQRSADAIDTQRQRSRLGAYKLVGYVEDTWKPTPRWEVQPGVRISYFSGGNYMHVRPRLSAHYTVHPDYLVVQGAAGAHVQYVHRLRDRYSLAYDLVSSRWIPASPRVRPASSLQATVGGQSSPLSGLALELAAYGRVARNILIPEDVYRTKDGLEGPGIEVGALLGQYTPAQERTLGMELTARYEVGPWRLQWGGAWGRAAVRVLDREEGHFRPADLDVPLSTQAAISWSRGPWEATLAAEARSGYPQSVPVARYKLGDPIDEPPETYLYRPQANNGRLPTYARLDAHLGYRFSWLNAGWTARLGLYNVTNRRNVVSRRFAPTETGVDTTERSGLPLLPLFEMEVAL